MLLSIATVVITFSRAGFLTLIVIILLGSSRSSAAACRARRSRFVLLALVVPPMLPPGYMDRLNTITDIESDRTGSAQGRWEDFGAAVDVVIKNPDHGRRPRPGHPGAERGARRDVAIGAQRLPAVRRRPRPARRCCCSSGCSWRAFRGAKRVRVRAAREPHLRDLAVLAGGVQIALVAFAVEAIFHPIAYQFYFYCIGGLAVALQNTCRTELAMIRIVRRADPPTWLRAAGSRRMNTAPIRL